MPTFPTRDVVASLRLCDLQRSLSAGVQFNGVGGTPDAERLNVLFAEAEKLTEEPIDSLQNVGSSQLAAPLFMVEASQNAEQLASHDQTQPRALILQVDVKPSTFLSSDVHGDAARDLKIEVFVNGELLDARYVNGNRRQAHKILFGGLRVFRQGERVLVYKLRSQLEGSGHNAASLWQSVARSLASESHSRGVGQGGALQPTAESLLRLSASKLPNDYQDKHGLAIIDVVLTAGMGIKKTGSGASYLSGPTKFRDPAHNTENPIELEKTNPELFQEATIPAIVVRDPQGAAIASGAGDARPGPAAPGNHPNAPFGGSLERLYQAVAAAGSSPSDFVAQGPNSVIKSRYGDRSDFARLTPNQPPAASSQDPRGNEQMLARSLALSVHRLHMVRNSRADDEGPLARRIIAEGDAALSTAGWSKPAHDDGVVEQVAAQAAPQQNANETVAEDVPVQLASNGSCVSLGAEDMLRQVPKSLGGDFREHSVIVGMRFLVL